MIGVTFRPFAKEICKVLVEKCFKEFENDDFVLNILEEILKLFLNYISEDDPQLIISILTSFAALY